MTGQDAEARHPEHNREARIRRAVRLVEVLMVIGALAVVTLGISGRSVPNGAYMFVAALGFALGLLTRSLPARRRHDQDRQ